MGGGRLRRLVLVVGKDQIGPAAVDLEADAEQSFGHRRALNVPARSTLAPRRLPGRVLAGLLRLPQREVGRIALAPGALHSLPLVHLLQIAMGKLTVFGIAADREVHVSLRRIGVPALDQPLDQVDDLRDRGACQGLVVGPSDSKSIGVGHVGVDHLARQLLAADPGCLRRRINLVVHIRYVRNECYVVALMDEHALEQREHDVRAGVAHVNAPVHSRTARIHAYAVARARLDRQHPAGAGVVEADRSSHDAATLAPAGASGRSGR